MAVSSLTLGAVYLVARDLADSLGQVRDKSLGNVYSALHTDKKTSDRVNLTLGYNSSFGDNWTSMIRLDYEEASASAPQFAVNSLGVSQRNLPKEVATVRISALDSSKEVIGSASLSFRNIAQFQSLLYELSSDLASLTDASVSFANSATNAWSIKPQISWGRADDAYALGVGVGYAGLNYSTTSYAEVSDTLPTGYALLATSATGDSIAFSGQYHAGIVSDSDIANAPATLGLPVGLAGGVLDTAALAGPLWSVAAREDTLGLNLLIRLPVYF